MERVREIVKKMVNVWKRQFRKLRRIIRCFMFIKVLPV